MPLADFDYLLRDCRVAFGENAWPEWAMAVVAPIKGRFASNPFTVPLAPSENGLSVTQIFFFYDARHDLPNSVRPARMGDFLTIRGVRYEVIDVQDDDLGESGLQLTRASQTRPPVVWDDGATIWLDDADQPVVWAT
jgi:hypothetical protein